METITLLIFCVVLMSYIIWGFSILYALAIGFAVFFIYGLARGFGWRELLHMAADGVKTVKNMAVIFLLIGMLTALWRASGTIPVIVCYASRLIQPSIFILMTFLLCCGVSVLTGTALGTAATMGVICMTMATAMGMSPLFTGGAIISGSFFGDRCSPVSTSALLICELTDTDIFSNIRRMLRTVALPFLLCCVVYAAIGFIAHGTAAPADVTPVFAREFRLHPLALLPAAAILLLAVFKVKVRTTMITSCAIAAVICLTVERTAPAELLRLLFAGYRAADPTVAAMLNGGGIISMLKVIVIVCISSSYAGIFNGTGLLNHLKELIAKASGPLTPFGCILCTATATSMISCNQTLAIILTHQLCNALEQDKHTLALDLENSAVVIAPLVPWCIASAVPVATIGAPTSCLLAACFLYLLPLWTLASKLIDRHRRGRIVTDKK